MSYITKHQTLAYRIAIQSTSQFRLGAVLAKGSTVLNVGVNNMRRTHPLQQKYSKKPLGTHAEVSACCKVNREDIQGATLYICRVLKNDKIALSKPCNCCMQILNLFGIKKVYYSTNYGDFKTLYI